MVIVWLSISSMCKRSRQATASMETKSYFMELSAKGMGIEEYVVERISGWEGRLRGWIERVRQIMYEREYICKYGSD